MAQCPLLKAQGHNSCPCNFRDTTRDTTQGHDRVPYYCVSLSCPWIVSLSGTNLTRKFRDTISGTRNPWNRVVLLNRVPERVPESAWLPCYHLLTFWLSGTQTRGTIQGHNMIVFLKCLVPKCSKICPNVGHNSCHVLYCISEIEGHTFFEKSVPKLRSGTRSKDTAQSCPW